MDALYFRVSTDQQTTENQFEDLLQVAEKDGFGRNWARIRAALAACITEEHRPTTRGTIRTVYRLQPELAHLQGFRGTVQGVRKVDTS
jgi:hypothetical protein